MLRMVGADLRFYAKGRPGRYLRTFLWDRQFHVMLLYRLGRYCASRRGLHRLCPYLRYLLGTVHSCDFSFKAEIGARLHLPHPIGIVIGEGVTIHDDVTVFQHVTIGSHGRQGTSLDYPVVESRVRIYANSTVVGGVRIGAGAIVGAQSLVVSNVRGEMVYAGVPARKLYRVPSAVTGAPASE